MAMKKILIASDAMEIGGAETALLGLLNSFDYSKYSVDLFLNRHKGEFMPLIPREINILPEKKEYAALAAPIAGVIKTGRISQAYGRAVGKFKARRYCAKNNIGGAGAVYLEYSHKYTVKFMPEINPEVKYDLAVSFMTPHYFVARKARADKKIAWIHTDYSYINVDAASELKMWSAYDNIISISEGVTKSFLSKFPTLGPKIILIENIISPELINRRSERSKAADDMPAEEGVVRLLSVGRFSDAKNFDNIPFICKIIRENGINVKWYLIGYGGDEGLIRRKIKEAGAEDYVIILGKKENPYPYIKACDIYVQPSRYEGKAVTVRETQILAKPVVITDFPTAKSQLNDGFDGIIVPLDNIKCAEGIIGLIKDKKKQEELINNCKRTNYDNKNEIEKLYALIE